MFLKNLKKRHKNTCWERYKADGLPVDSNRNDNGGGDSLEGVTTMTEGTTMSEVEDSMLPASTTVFEFGNQKIETWGFSDGDNDEYQAS